MPTIFTAIFGPYDQLKDPLVITPGWDYVCYTNQDFKSDIWKIKKINPPGDARRAARFIKINFFNFIFSGKSIWIDGSFTINCDLDKFWNENFKGEMTCIKHPIRNCIFEEGAACISLGRGEKELIEKQLLSYTGNVPKGNGLIQSGILMRQRTRGVIKVCEEWFNEIENYSSRDQISFGKVSMNNPIINYIEWDYRSGKEFIFTRHNIKS
jgi:hypothetical protein